MLYCKQNTVWIQRRKKLERNSSFAVFYIDIWWKFVYPKEHKFLMIKSVSRIVANLVDLLIKCCPNSSAAHRTACILFRQRFDSACCSSAAHRTARILCRQRPDSACCSSADHRIARILCRQRPDSARCWNTNIDASFNVQWFMLKTTLNVKTFIWILNEYWGDIASYCVS